MQDLFQVGVSSLIDDQENVTHPATLLFLHLPRTVREMLKIATREKWHMARAASFMACRMLDFDVRIRTANCGTFSSNSSQLLSKWKNRIPASS